MQSTLVDSPIIEVINLRHCGDFGTRDGDFRIDRGSKWGNPYKITKTCTREQCIAQYEKYFVETLLKDIGELNGARRLGCWCFGAGTLVTTSRGFIPIENVVIGDMVLSHDSEYHRVSNVMKRDNVDTIEVKIMGIPESIICTPEHEFYTCDRIRVQSNYNREIVTTNPSWIPAIELEKSLNTSHSCGMVVGFPKDLARIGDLYGDNFWYLVGRYLGDGWIINYKSKSGYIKTDGSQSLKQVFGVGLCTGKDDGDNLERLIASSGFTYDRYEGKTDERFRIFSKELVEFLTQFGRYSNGKLIPEWCFSLPKESQISLLDGIIDADGYIDCKRNTVTTVSRLMAFGIARLVRNVYGCKTSMCKKSLSKKPHYINGREIHANYQPYCISWSNRYIDNVDTTDNFVWMPFRNITRGDLTTVYNLTVEESESYVVNGVAVHNCKPKLCHGDVIKKYLENV